MLGDKSSVSALHEYCAKMKIPLPTFEFSSSDENRGFDCEVEVDGVIAHASGRSKRDAKHLASVNLIAKLRKLKPRDTENIPMAAEIDTAVPTTDMVGALRDYCIQLDHPLPVFDMVQQGGTPDAPEFIIVCSVASIKRYGVSDKKKDARQKAAYEILQVIMEDRHLESQSQIATLDAKATQVEEERYFKFKTYRELTDAKSGQIPGCLLTDRHYYFTKFYDNLKADAMKIINNDAYESDKSKAVDLLNALKLKPTITSLKTATAESMWFVDLNCEYDVVFAGNENVYKDIVDYFRNMLY